MSLFAQQYGSCPSHVLGIESLVPSIIDGKKAGDSNAPRVGVARDRVSPISAIPQSIGSNKADGQEEKIRGIYLYEESLLICYHNYCGSL